MPITLHWEIRNSMFWTPVQGHPMDLFLKISVLQANCYQLGEKSNKMFLEGKCCWAKDNSGRLRGFDLVEYY